MANPEHVEILKRGISEWNQWREANPDIKPDLAGANLAEAILNGAILGRANLFGANLTKAGLDWADLSSTLSIYAA